MQHDRQFRTRNLLTILGAALVIGGGALAASVLADRPAVVKPATGTAQAMALAADKPAAH